MKMVAVFGTFLLAVGQVCRQNTVRLGETTSPSNNTWKTDSPADTVLVRYYGGRGYGYGGYRGYGYGGYRGYGYGGYGYGYPGYGYGGYGGYYGYPGYGYGGYGYGYPSYGYGGYGYGYPSYGYGGYGYGYPSYGYGGYGYGRFGVGGRYYRLTYTDSPAPAQAPQGQGDTYLMSLPKQTTAAVLPVSLPSSAPTTTAAPGKYTYRAYGE